MTNLNLPFVQSGSTGQLAIPGWRAFSITLTDGGGTAVCAESYGTGEYGDPATALYAESDGTAVRGQGKDGGTAVAGYADTGVGVFGVRGEPTVTYDLTPAVVGLSADSYGIFGGSDASDGVKGVSASPLHAGVLAINTSGASGQAQAPSGFAVWASSNNTGIFAQGTPAGYFAGDVLVTGDMVLLNSSGDVAEDFDVEAEPLNAEPGTVLIINESGNLCVSDAPYDTRVASVVAGAGDLKPAVVLQRVPSQKPRSPIALVGKVFCKVDAAFGKVVAGDLLTTSATPGYAMKASDRSRALGAIIGKALARGFHGKSLWGWVVHEEWCSDAKISPASVINWRGSG
ncbi:hypothetical protein [Mycobacterium sp.]|uniref:hypothetical protein n=1 Tax=Mycobacterium sp. TaxID=1785 RepID=UPI003F9BFE4B